MPVPGDNVVYLDAFLADASAKRPPAAALSRQDKIRNIFLSSLPEDSTSSAAFENLISRFAEDVDNSR